MVEVGGVVALLAGSSFSVQLYQRLMRWMSVGLMPARCPMTSWNLKAAHKANFGLEVHPKSYSGSAVLMVQRPLAEKAVAL